VAKINEADPYFEDWDSPDDLNWEAELLSRAAARGQKFERLVDEVIGKIAWDKRNRDPVRLWLIVCVESFECKTVQADVRDWCLKVSKSAASLAKLLERHPFPPGSPQLTFGIVYEDHDGIDLPSADDVAHLRKMVEAANVMARGYRKSGRTPRRDREELIQQLAGGFERLMSRRATATAGNAFCGVVTVVLAFLGEYPEEDTVTGAVKRALKIRRRLRRG
jgi:hypothetical protein